jgi:hypothetical protein
VELDDLKKLWMTPAGKKVCRCNEDESLWSPVGNLETTFLPWGHSGLKKRGKKDRPGKKDAPDAPPEQRMKEPSNTCVANSDSPTAERSHPKLLNQVHQRALVAATWPSWCLVRCCGLCQSANRLSAAFRDTAVFQKKSLAPSLLVPVGALLVPVEVRLSSVPVAAWSSRGSLVSND